MKISMFCLCVNLVFAVLLLKVFSGTGVKGEAGLAIANTLSAAINVVLLIYGLRRKLARLGLRSFARTLLVLVPNAFLAGLVAAGLGWLWEARLGHASLALKIGAVFGPGAAASALYWMLALWFKVPAARETYDLLARKILRS